MTPSQCVRGSILFAATMALALVPPAVRGAADSAETIVRIDVLPDALELTDLMNGRRVVVTGRTADGKTFDLSAEATLEPADDIVVVGDDGFLRPVRAGKTTVVVSAAGHKVELPVVVGDVSQPRSVSYVRDVVPVINKAGCTAGTCHGNLKGKNGFKLSLRGYDPAGDYRELIDDVWSRRINRSDPTQSLMLLKPTQGVPHEGGLVFETDSRYYEVIRRWIAEGLVNDVGKVQRAERIEVLPDSPLLHRPGLSQQLIVIAHYPDGSTRDVTREAIYTSSKPIVAEVDTTGRVEAIRSGEAAMVVRYEGRYATNLVTILSNRAGFAWVDLPEYNYIDQLVHKKLERMHILPSPLCDDATFMRRVSFDLIGLPPSPGQVEAFLHDSTDSRLKRQRLVDQLMDRPEFVDYWTMKWADLLQCNRKYLGEKGVWAFRNWLREAVASNLPFDEFVRQLLTSNGSTYDNPAAAYYRVSREPDASVEQTTQLFLGTRFACNKCHDHPFERWTQDNYYSLSAYFAQVGRKKGARKGEEIIFERRDGGHVTHPKSGQVVPPAFPFEVPGLEAHAGMSRREELAQWVTSPENPLFAKSVANRIFSYFFGRGIIDPVDDIRASNPPSNPALLAALADDFKNHGFDIRHLIRTLVTSRTYQLSIETNEWNVDDLENFSHAMPRRLNAEQLLDAITMATGHREKFTGVPVTFRASQLPDNGVGKGGFLDLFGRPPRESACECERRTEVSFAQALNLVNGPTIAAAVSDPKGRVARVAKEAKSDREVVELLYLAALCRAPRPEEVRTGVEHLKSSKSREEGAQDLMWGLLNSPAFLFNR